MGFGQGIRRKCFQFLNGPLSSIKSFWSVANKLGVFFSVFYIVTSVLCVVYAFDPVYDEKSRFVLLQLPVAVQTAVLLPLFNSIGYLDPLLDMSWVQAYALCVLPFIFVLYFSGVFLSKVFEIFFRNPDQPE